jgi:hypothetical protein
MIFDERWRAAFAAALLSVSAGATAHSDDGDSDRGAAGAVLDCTHPPADALRGLPAPIDRWTALTCMPNGQMLHQKPGWSWRFPASFTSQVMIPAAVAAEPQDAFGRYFSSMEIATLEGEAAAQLHAQLARDVPTYAFRFGDKLAESRPKAIYRVRARNDKGGEFVLHMVYRSDQDIWGLVCTPECVPESLFVVSRQGQ